ncbi:hypothetical protein GCM10023063_48900 [Arthrobacter methylotrophus]
MGPELPGKLELLVDMEGLGRVNRAVFCCRRVIKLTQRGVSGSRVVPRSGAFQAGFVESLKEGDGPVGFELLDERTRVALMIPPPIRTTSAWCVLEMKVTINLR